MELATGVTNRGLIAAVALTGAVAAVASVARGGTAPSDVVHEHVAAARGELQAAVTADGFLVAQQTARGRQVLAVGRDGTHHHLAEVAREGDVRVVGTTAGPTAGYQDGPRVRLTRIADGKELGMWGTRAQRLCDGVASNDQRFAVGWLEDDGRVWIVHGPTKRRGVTALADSVATPYVREAAPATWCGVASADHKVALFWRDRDRLLFGMCTEKRCGGLSASVPFSRSNVVLGMGCLRNACLVAHRESTGKAMLTYVTESGSRKWSKPLPTDATSVSIVGAGGNAFAVGFSNRDGSHVLRVDRKGGTSQRWRGSAGSGVPELAWSADHLLIAHYTNDTLTPISLSFPR